MKFYIPTFRIATLQPPQAAFVNKLGGLPWGLPAERWADCQRCDEPMSLLAQLRHDPPALPIAGGLVLHLFQCQQCYGFSPEEGNAALLVAESELGDGLTNAPREMRLVGELWIDGWTERDDGLSPDLVEAFYDEDAHLHLDDEVAYPLGFSSRNQTKAGGLPYWTGNGPQGMRRSPEFELLLQLDTFLYLDGEPPDANAVGCRVSRKTDPQTGQPSEVRTQQPERVLPNAPWYLAESSQEEPGQNLFCEFSNFGSDGTAYVMINRSVSPPEVYWFWNR